MRTRQFNFFVPRKIERRILLGEMELGTGTFGHVLAAGDGLAVKEVRGEDLGTAVTEIVFLTHIHSYGRLDNVIHLERYEFGETCAELYMPRYQTSLAAVLMTLRAHEIMAIVPQLLNGLFNIHSRLVIHCDIKPANILLNMPAGGRIRACICDFGISLSMREQRHHAHVVSLMYRPPEIDEAAETLEYGGEIDVFSMGLVILEMMLGRRLPDKDFDTSLEAIGSLMKLRAHSERELLAALYGMSWVDVRARVEQLYEKHAARELATARAGDDAPAGFTRDEFDKMANLITMMIIPNPDWRASAWAALNYWHGTNTPLTSMRLPYRPYIPQVAGLPIADQLPDELIEPLQGICLSLCNALYVADIAEIKEVAHTAAMCIVCSFMTPHSVWLELGHGDEKVARCIAGVMNSPQMGELMKTWM